MVRWRTMFEKEGCKLEVIRADRAVEGVAMAIAAVGRLVVGHDFGAVVFNHGINDMEVVALTGFPESAVAAPRAIPVVPRGVMGECEVDGWEMVEQDSALQDDVSELLGGDSDYEGGAEEVVEGVAGAEKAAERGDGQVIADGENKFTGQVRE